MSIISFITDSHFSNSIPERRKDNLYDNQFLKYKEFVKITNEIKAIPYHGGDFTDTHRPPLTFLNRLNEITCTLHSTLNCVLGNHDIVGYNWNTHKDCAIGNFVSSGLAEVAETKDYGDFRIVIFHFTSKHSISMYKEIFKNSEKPTIIFSHNMIVKNEVVYPHILASDLIKILPENTLILSGHYHAPFDVQSGSKRIMNPGSFLRLERMKSNSRVPQMLLIDTNNLEVKKQQIQSALSAKEIFDFDDSVPEEVLPMALNLDNLKLELKKVELRSKNLRDVLGSIADKNKLKPEVLNISMEYIQLAEEEFQNT